jgi:hypothetical protein
MAKVAARPQIAHDKKYISTAKRDKPAKKAEAQHQVTRQDTSLYPKSPMKQAHDAVIIDMKQHGASEADIAEFRRNEIIVMSIHMIKEKSMALEEKRTSPARFSHIDSKVHTINPYAKLLSSKGKLPYENNFSPSKSPSIKLVSASHTKYSEKNAKDLVPATKERMPLLSSTLARLEAHDLKIELQ